MPKIKKIRVLGRDIPILEGGSLPGDAVGLAVQYPPAILLHRILKNSLAEQHETLLHEILHMCSYKSGLAARLNEGDNDIDDEEIVSTLSPVLYAALKDSGMLTDWEIVAAPLEKDDFWLDLISQVQGSKSKKKG